MDPNGFIKEHVDVFKDFSAERIAQLVARLARQIFRGQGSDHASRRRGDALRCGVERNGCGQTRQWERLGELKPGDTFAELSLMSGNPLLADFVAASPCEVLLIPVSLFQSIIVSEPAAVHRVSRTIADRMNMLMTDPAKAAAALRESDDPYGLKLKGERPEKILVINCGSSSLKYSFYDTQRCITARPRRDRTHRNGWHATQASWAEGFGEA